MEHQKPLHIDELVKLKLDTMPVPYDPKAFEQIRQRIRVKQPLKWLRGYILGGIVVLLAGITLPLLLDTKHEEKNNAVPPSTTPVYQQPDVSADSSVKANTLPVSDDVRETAKRIESHTVQQSDTAKPSAKETNVIPERAGEKDTFLFWP